MLAAEDAPRGEPAWLPADWIQPDQAPAAWDRRHNGTARRTPSEHRDRSTHSPRTTSCQQTEQPPQVMGQWWLVLPQVKQPGLEGFLHRLLQPEAPGTFSKHGRIAGCHRCLEISCSNPQQTLRLREGNGEASLRGKRDRSRGCASGSGPHIRSGSRAANPGRHLPEPADPREHSALQNGGGSEASYPVRRSAGRYRNLARPGHAPWSRTGAPHCQEWPGGSGLPSLAAAARSMARSTRSYGHSAGFDPLSQEALNPAGVP